MDKLRIARAIDGLTEWQEHVQPDSDIEKNIDTALEALRILRDAPDINDGDTIYRQAAIDALDKRFDSVPMEQTAEILMLRKDLRELPAAQSEIIRCKDCKYCE